MAIDQITAIEATAAQGGARTISVIGLSLDQAQRAEERVATAERRTALAEGWRDRWSGKVEGLVRANERLTTMNEFAWERARANGQMARFGWGAAFVLAFIAVALLVLLMQQRGI